MEKLLNLPVLASEHGLQVNHLMVYIHWLMFSLFAGWLIYFLYALWRFSQKRNRRGDYDGAKLVLVKTAVRIRAYAAADPEMLRWAQELELAQDEYGGGMDAASMKEKHFIATSMVHNRTYDGKAKRKPGPSRG